VSTRDELVAMPVRYPVMILRVVQKVSCVFIHWLSPFLYLIISCRVIAMLYFMLYFTM